MHSLHLLMPSLSKNSPLESISVYIRGLVQLLHGFCFNLRSKGFIVIWSMRLWTPLYVENYDLAISLASV